MSGALGRILLTFLLIQTYDCNNEGDTNLEPSVKSKDSPPKHFQKRQASSISSSFLSIQLHEINWIVKLISLDCWIGMGGESRQREEDNKRERERRAVELSLGGLWACRSSPRKHPTNQLHLHSVNLLGFLGCLLRKATTSPRCPQMKKEREPNPHSFFSLRMAS